MENRSKNLRYRRRWALAVYCAAIALLYLRSGDDGPLEYRVALGALVIGFLFFWFGPDGRAGSDGELPATALTTLDELDVRRYRETVAKRFRWLDRVDAGARALIVLGALAVAIWIFFDLKDSLPARAAVATIAGVFIWAFYRFALMMHLRGMFDIIRPHLIGTCPACRRRIGSTSGARALVQLLPGGHYALRANATCPLCRTAFGTNEPSTP